MFQVIEEALNPVRQLLDEEERTLHPAKFRISRSDSCHEVHSEECLSPSHSSTNIGVLSQEKESEICIVGMLFSAGTQMFGRLSALYDSCLKENPGGNKQIDVESLANLVFRKLSRNEITGRIVFSRAACGLCLRRTVRAKPLHRGVACTSGYCLHSSPHSILASEVFKAVRRLLVLREVHNVLVLFAPGIS